MNRRQVLVIGICALVCAFALHVIVRSVRETAPITGRVLQAGATVDAAARALRPNYPYSVIPGGAYSPMELRAAAQREKLVRDHFADFDMGAAHLVTLTADRYQYVSYRQNNAIFWTRKRLKIAKGEVLLTDGRNYARTRCGNRLSDVARGPASPLQPPDRVLSLPPFTPALFSRGVVELASAPPPGDLAQAYPVLPFDSPRLAPYLPPETEAKLRLPEDLPLLGGGGVFPFAPGAAGWAPAAWLPPPSWTPSNTPTPQLVQSPPPVPSEVPEPRSLLLFGVALGASGWILGRMARSGSRIAHNGPTGTAKEGENSLRR